MWSHEYGNAIAGALRILLVFAALGMLALVTTIIAAAGWLISLAF